MTVYMHYRMTKVVIAEATKTKAALQQEEE
jgi:hypothetical protein